LEYLSSSNTIEGITYNKKREQGTEGRQYRGESLFTLTLEPLTPGNLEPYFVLKLLFLTVKLC
jgi:hypothetical protein